MSGLARLAMALSLFTFLAACGGQNDNGGTPPVDDTPVVPDPVFTIGSGSGTNFSAGTLDASSTDLAGGESSTITASIADETGALLTEDASVTFRSDCEAIGDATIDTPVSLVNGFATTVYQPQGCVGEDNITASVTVNGNTTNASVTVTVRQLALLGSATDAGFEAGVLTFGMSSISAGGSTTLTASVADGDGNAVDATASTVTFSSACSSSGLAEIESPVAAEGSIVETTYTALGCTGDDVVTARVTIDGATSTASGTVTVLAPVVGSLQFVSAVPETIGIRGFGLNETSRVTFLVLDTNGNPVRNEDVSFSLNTSVGGISLSDSSATSNAEGEVVVNVTSGFVQTSVAVSAQLVANPALGTQSDRLVVSTGIADQDSMSLSASCLNPEGWNYDGETVDLTLRASDHFNNPVPDGTAVAFTTEGGQVQPTCSQFDGACTVVWSSSNPRPINGRATILATVLGEESFLDANGNGVLDDQDTFFDVTEAFRDDTENGEFDQGVEEFRDFNNNAEFDSGDGAYNGVLCCDADAVSNAVEGDACFGRTPTGTACSDNRNIHARDSIVLVMAKSFMNFETDVESLNGSGSVLVSIFGLMDDGSKQVPPCGTQVSAVATNGVIGDVNFTVPSTNFDGPLQFGIFWQADATPSTGTICIETVTPNENESAFCITVVD